MTEPERLIEKRCLGCSARDLEESLLENSDDKDALRAAEIFKNAHARAKELLKDNPNLLRKQNVLARELGDIGPQAEGSEEEVFGTFTFKTIAQSGVNCAVMQTTKACRLVNPVVR